MHNKTRPSRWRTVPSGRWGASKSDREEQWTPATRCYRQMNSRTTASCRCHSNMQNWWLADRIRTTKDARSASESTSVRFHWQRRRICAKFEHRIFVNISHPLNCLKLSLGQCNSSRSSRNEQQLKTPAHECNQTIIQFNSIQFNTLRPFPRSNFSKNRVNIIFGIRFLKWSNCAMNVHQKVSHLK